MMLVSPREYWMFFFDDAKAAYAEVLRATPDDPEYLECKVHTEGEPTDIFEVHHSKFVYPLSKAQFVTAWYAGFPDHPRRWQAIVNLVKGGTA